MIVSPSGSLLRLRAPVLAFGLLDASFALMADRPDPLAGVRPTCRAGQPGPPLTGGGGTNNNNNSGSAPSSPGCPQGDQLVLAVATEKVYKFSIESRIKKVYASWGSSEYSSQTPPSLLFST